MEEKRYGYRVWEKKSEGKTPLGRQKHNWDNNIKMDVKKIR
jgi:hypothetical protein